ncbi:MerR family transcriptional regulator [Actinomyces massiliensis]|uniref:MerR family transcriptional regulator n=1 Tax=Actinomyces massiliensis TaxID=461393 RepID=UPI0028E9471F|nr:MerR family transcriptional regulator [Actinomyces massiliensis]
MRVAQIARLTGTTVRTVRYYHSLGLLPVPEERGGWRDYELSHVARLSRIRWLTQAGVPLETIARVLDAEPVAASGDEAGGSADSEAPETHAPEQSSDRQSAVPASDVVTDLTAALRAIDDHLEDITRQRDMLAKLLEQAQEGSAVSPMSPRMAEFFDRMERAAPDERTRAAVRRERDITDLACYRGQMPPEADFLFFEADAIEDAAALASYGRDPMTASQTELEEHADRIVARVERRLSPAQLHQLASRVDTAAVRSFFRLIASVDPHYAEIGPLVEHRFMRAIDHWRKAETLPHDRP